MIESLKASRLHTSIGSASIYTPRMGLEIPSSYGYLAGYLDDGPNGEVIPEMDFYAVFQAAGEVEKLLNPCGFKNGWLWEYTPELQKEYRRFNPPKKATQEEFDF